MVTFASAYLIEKADKLSWLRSTSYFLSMIPMALPGLVIGIAFIFFFNPLQWRIGGLVVPNPFSSLYGTMAILVLANIIAEVIAAMAAENSMGLHNPTMVLNTLGRSIDLAHQAIETANRAAGTNF